MNTAVNANAVSSGAAAAKVAHVFREHGLVFSKKRVSQEDENNSGAIVIRPFVFNKEKEGIGIPRSLSQKICTYRKRLEKAENPETKKRLISKISELENERNSYTKKRRGREASLVEISWSITMFPPKEALLYDSKIGLRLGKIADELCFKYFPNIPKNKIGLAAHVDQASIHVHTVFDVPDGTTYSAMLNSAKEKMSLGEGESIYSRLQQDFNNAVRVEFPDLKIEQISGVKKDYLPLREFKRVPVEVEKVVEKVVHVQDNTRILELETALKTTKSLLVETQSALELETQKKDRYAQNNAIVEKFFSEKGFSANPGEGFWSFLKRIFVELVTKVGDLVKENAQLKRERDLAELVQSSTALEVDKVVSTPEKPEPEPTDLNQWLLENNPTTQKLKP